MNKTRFFVQQVCHFVLKSIRSWVNRNCAASKLMILCFYSIFLLIFLLRLLIPILILILIIPPTLLLLVGSLLLGRIRSTQPAFESFNWVSFLIQLIRLSYVNFYGLNIFYCALSNSGDNKQSDDRRSNKQVQLALINKKINKSNLNAISDKNNLD